MAQYSDEVLAVNNPLPPNVVRSDRERDEHHLLLLARADAVKGHRFAESLTTALRNKQPGWRLSMTGLAQSDVEGVTALGWVSAEKKQSLLDTATLLLVPSSYEGQPMVVLEALASGCPVIVSSRVHLPPECVNVAKHNDLEDWLEQAMLVQEHPVDRSTLRSSVKEHEVIVVQGRWKQIYEDVVANSSKAE